MFVALSSRNSCPDAQNRCCDPLLSISAIVMVNSNHLQFFTNRNHFESGLQLQLLSSYSFCLWWTFNSSDEDSFSGYTHHIVAGIFYIVGTNVVFVILAV